MPSAAPGGARSMRSHGGSPSRRQAAAVSRRPTGAGGEYMVRSVAPPAFARLAPRTATVGLQQFTNVADPLFTPLANGLRQATMLGAAAPPLAMESLVAAAVDRISVLLDASRQK